MRCILFVLLGFSIFFGQNALAGQLWQAQGNAKGASDGLAQSASINDAAALSIDLNTDVIFSMQPGQSGAIFLPDGKFLNAHLGAIKSHALGGKSWLGWAGEGVNRGRIVMTQVNGFTFAAITYDNKLYLIEPARNATGHIIFAASQPGMIELGFGDDEVPYRAIKTSVAKTDDLARPTAVGTIGTVDVGIFFHSSMRDHWGLGLSSRLQFLIQNYDTAMNDSGTGIRGNLVHISEITGTLEKSNSEMLTAFSSGTSSADGDFSGVAALRDAKGFDIGVYIRRFKAATHGSCGIGFVPGGSGGVGSITAASAGGGFNVTSDDFDIDATLGASGRPMSASLCSIFTMAHEIGHNMGNTHETGTPDSGVFTFSHGHRVDGVFRTIMSRNSSTREPRLGFFSSPTLLKCTDSGGGSGATTACGVVDVADNVRSMSTEGKNVQLYKAAAPRIVSSVLPVSRSIKSDATATAFAVVINPVGAGTATGCALGLPGASAAQFSYQTTTPANALSGTPDTPIDIPAGGFQNFIFSITPGGEYKGFTPDVFSPVFMGADLAIDFSCTNRQSAESIAKLNTLSFTAEAGDVMDVIALGTTGIVDTGGGTGVFAVSVSNIGAAGTVTASAVNSSASVTATTTVCETVTATGACKSAPAASVDVTLAKDETASFGFFVTETAPIVADFAQKRIIAQFKEGAALRGATSVAVRTAP